ncbi:MAG: hypothetical protein QXU18_04640 [Thermoplasmatales archaeon]
MNKSERLGIKSMEIVETEKFFQSFADLRLTFWLNDNHVYYMINKFAGYSFATLPDAGKIIVFFGSDGDKFGVGMNHGFGFRSTREDESHEHFWVDRVDEHEAAVIFYAKQEKSD